MKNEFIDPICGMTVTSETAAGSFTHNGETYYFCSTGCLEKFKKKGGKQAGQATWCEIRLPSSLGRSNRPTGPVQANRSCATIACWLKALPLQVWQSRQWQA